LAPHARRVRERIATMTTPHMRPRNADERASTEQRAQTRGLVDLGNRCYRFEFNSERGGPLTILLASASGFDGDGAEFAGRETRNDGTVREIDGPTALEGIGDALADAIREANADGHADIALTGIAHQHDGKVLFDSDDASSES
jgi:hypothetical protein